MSEHDEDMIITNGPDGEMIRRPMTPAEKQRFEEKAKKAFLKSAPEQAGVVEKTSLTPARKGLLKLLEENDVPRVTPVEVLGEKYFIRTLNFPELTRLGMLTNRNADGLLDLSQTDNLASLTAAMLFCCVASDEQGKVDYFGSLSEANRAVESTSADVRQIVNSLFNHCLQATPEILPGAVPDATPEQAEAREKKDVSGPTDGGER